MRQRLYSIAVLFLTLLSLAARGDDPLSGGNARPSSIFDGGNKFLPVTEAYRLEPGIEDGRLVLDWTIAPGYYLYKHRFGTAAETADGKFTPLEQGFEQGQMRYDDFYERELEVYYDQTRVTPKWSPEKGRHRLKVESQGCADAGLCYPPRTQYVEVDFDSSKARVVAGTPTTPATGPTPEGAAAKLPLILSFAVLGGLILNLMPCVFPVLSIKALSLATSHTGAHGRHLHGLAYTGGVVLAFAVIALAMIALRAGGDALGWGFQLQSPLFVAGLVYLFYLMGLGLSGFFLFGANWMSLGQAATEGGGLRHSFFTGVLATVVASPCTAPFMGTALGFALTQPAAVALLIFTCLGLGMALPFLVITWWPGAGRWLPRPGPWMKTFKEFLAFPLFLTCAWLLWVLGRQAGSDAVAATVTGLILLAFALWLQHRQRPVTTVAAGLVVATALALPLYATVNKEKANVWEPYSSQRLEQLLDEDRPVFVNLTADWCLTCLANEKLALSSDSFHQLLSKEGIVYLKGDWTNYDPEITALLNANNRSGVPLYLFYPPGSDKPKILPQLLTSKIIKRSLSQQD